MAYTRTTWVDGVTPVDATRLNNIDGAIEKMLAGGADGAFTAMPYVGSAPIVESGVNANGTYIKFADGTMICRITSLITLDINTADGSIFYGATSWTFPATFYAAPTVPAAAFAAASASLWGGATGATNTTSTALGVFGATSVTAGSVTVHAIAVGRWKA